MLPEEEIRGAIVDGFPKLLKGLQGQDRERRLAGAFEPVMTIRKDKPHHVGAAITTISGSSLHGATNCKFQADALIRGTFQPC